MKDRCRWMVTLTVASLAAGWAGCGLFKSEAPSTHPLEFVRKDADAVVELRDIGMFADLRASLTEQFSGVISKSDVSAMQDELALLLGFDPTTEDGLRGVGLATRGPIAGELLADGTGALWAVPVAKPKTLAPVIETVMKARFGIDEVNGETRDGVALTIFAVEFGAKKVVRAAHATTRGHLVMGFGPQAADLVVRAVKLPANAAARHNPEYRAQAARLGDTYDLRMISAEGGQALEAGLKRVRRRDALALKPLLDRVTSAGWTLRYHDGALKADARARLDEEGLAKAKRVFAVKGAAPAGVRAVNLERAVVFVQAAGDPRALLDTLAPPGSEQRGELEGAAQRLQDDLDIDLFGTVLPNFSGHAALAVGTGDLSGVEFKALVGNPAGQTWTAFGASAKDARALAKVEAKLDGRLKEKQVEIRTRKVGEAEIRDIIPLVRDEVSSTEAKPGDALFSTFTHGGAWGFSVEPVVAEAIVKNAGGKDELDGSPGLFGELRIARLITELRRFKLRELPIVYRALVLKVLDYMALLERITMRVEPSEDGLRMRSAVVFAPPAANAK